MDNTQKFIRMGKGTVLLIFILGLFTGFFVTKASINFTEQTISMPEDLADVRFGWPVPYVSQNHFSLVGDNSSIYERNYPFQQSVELPLSITGQYELLYKEQFYSMAVNSLIGVVVWLPIIAGLMRIPQLKRWHDNIDNSPRQKTSLVIIIGLLIIFCFIAYSIYSYGLYN